MNTDNHAHFTAEEAIAYVLGMPNHDDLVRVYVALPLVHRIAELERELADECQQYEDLREEYANARLPPPPLGGITSDRELELLRKIEALVIERDALRAQPAATPGEAANQELERYKQALQRANGFLIMHDLEPVKLEYDSASTKGSL